MLGNQRKARAGETLTRWVRITGHANMPHRAASLVAADATGTRFPGRVFHPKDLKSILVSGHSNIKLGRDVRKGCLRGYWIYSLSLEERATCPASCLHWRSCYGNSMPFGKRVEHGVELLEALDREIATLLAVRGRRGILIRLHALGDFYSEAYVGFWRTMLLKHPRLAVFGYTAHPPQSEIGRAIFRLMDSAPERCFIRFSNGGLPIESTVSIADAASCPPNAFICPEQTGRTQCCATCGACWGTTKNVAFLEH